MNMTSLLRWLEIYDTYNKVLWRMAQMAIAARGIFLDKLFTQAKRKSIHTNTVADFSNLQRRTNLLCNTLWMEARESWICPRRSQKFFSVRALKAYRESRITAPPILNLVTRRVECLTSRSGRFTPRKTPGTHWKQRGWAPEPNLLPLPVLEPRTVHLVVLALNRLR